MTIETRKCDFCDNPNDTIIMNGAWAIFLCKEHSEKLRAAEKELEKLENKGKSLKEFIFDEELEAMFLAIQPAQKVKPKKSGPKRNDKCHCGSNAKYKNCCMREDNEKYYRDDRGLTKVLE